MRFLVHYEGTGEGCDYTIGCNHSLHTIEAEDLANAIKKVLHQFKDYSKGLGGLYDIEEINAVTIFSITESASLDIERIRTLKHERMSAAETECRDQRDRATYEKLKARYAGRKEL